MLLLLVLLFHDWQLVCVSYQLVLSLAVWCTVSVLAVSGALLTVVKPPLILLMLWSR
jgi:hypothetical protein